MSESAGKMKKDMHVSIQSKHCWSATLFSIWLEEYAIEQVMDSLSKVVKESVRMLLSAAGSS